jgi:hypothetical protein
VLAFGAGLAAAIRILPASPLTPSGAAVFWVSRLTAAAAVAVLALDIYTAVKRQTSDEADALGGDLAALSLARDLGGALFEGGVLASLAAGVALVGAWLLRPDDANALEEDR